MRSAVAILLFAVCGTCGVVAAMPAPEGDHAAAAAHRVLLHDGFDGTALDRDTWNTCHWWAANGCTIAGNNELEWYLARQVRVRDGVLNLVAARRPTRGDRRTYPFASGMISSGPPYHSPVAKFAFRYGKAEIRAWIPSGRGLWPAFWLLPESRRSLPEIDVMEIIGQNADNVSMNFHYRTAGGREYAPGSDSHEPGLSTGWHTFAVNWRPGKLVWLIDGVPRWHFSGPAVPDERMYLVANLAVGGDWPGRPDSSTSFPTAFKLDYVKVSK
jgi:beta-glucanase (GH16 family)